MKLARFIGVILPTVVCLLGSPSLVAAHDCGAPSDCSVPSSGLLGCTENQGDADVMPGGLLWSQLFGEQGSFCLGRDELYAGEPNAVFKSGTGRMVFPNIGEYDGEFKDGKRHGKGKFTWLSGEFYDGSWENDKMSGEGCYRFSNGFVLNGTFVNSKPVIGKLTCANLDQANSSNSAFSMYYELSADGQSILFGTICKHLAYQGTISGLYGAGNAVIVYPSMNVYQGQCERGLRNGKGTFVWRDEKEHILSSYIGDWVNDCMHGQGTYRYSSGMYPRLVGNFSNNRPCGNLRYYTSKDKYYNTVWENGCCVSCEEAK